jgi:hypothetical protein
VNERGALGDRVDAARIARLWWPLAASWALMGAELPLFTAFVARMAEPERNLAAYGSIVFPLALVIESPIIMLLTASTALCSDWAAYAKLRRFMLAMAASLTALHVVVAFTPLYDVIAVHVMGAPPEVIEPGRLGFQIMTPWTAAIAYRRFQQGVLIRFERARLVGLGTLVRMLTNVVVLSLGFAAGRWSGIAVGASAVAAGVVSEALFAHWCVQPVLRERVRPAPVTSTVTRASFVRFYTPLALTPLVTLLAQPIGAAAMARMPLAFPSLATWPALHGLVFLTRALGLAYNEVVVALIGVPGAVQPLRRFTALLATSTTALLVAIAVSPLAHLWFAGWSGLAPELSSLGAHALLFSCLLPGLNAVQSLHQGALVHRRATRAVTEAVAISLAVTSLGLVACVYLQRWPALDCAVAMLTLGNVAQTAWLAWSNRTAARDPAAPASAPGAG